MSDSEQQARFEQLVLPRLDAAYKLARWPAGNNHDAKDVAQEAPMHAFRFVGGCGNRDGGTRPLTILRNTVFS